VCVCVREREMSGRVRIPHLDSAQVATHVRRQWLHSLPGACVRACVRVCVCRCACGRERVRTCRSVLLHPLQSLPLFPLAVPFPASVRCCTWSSTACIAVSAILFTAFF
jgi:hypothetical protein